MDNIKVEKKELLKILKENKKDHKEEFEEAWEAFREKATQNFEQLMKAAKKAKKGAEIKLNINLIQPQDHTEDFERIIQMLELDVHDRVELDQHEFTQYVQNNWDWARSFSAAYTSNTGKMSKFS